MVVLPAKSWMAPLFFVALAAAAPARAQDDDGQGGGANEPSANEMALAREQFRLGLTAAESGDWEGARLAFDRSYTLAPRPITLLNLAGADAQTAHYVEAAEAYRRFKHEATGRAAREIPAADEALAAIEPRIAHVHVEISHLAERDVVSVDGVEVSHAALGVNMPVNPGDHEITVVRSGERAGEARFHADEGERLADPVHIDLPEAPLDLGVGDDTGPRRRAHPDLFSDPLVWIGIGAGVAVVLLIIIGVVVASSGAPSPFSGNVPPGIYYVQ
jgi:hypothetical protein